MGNALLIPSSPSAITLRDYQDEATIAIFEWFDKNDGSPLVVVPTGGGKSLLLAEFIKRANEYYPGTRFIVLSHVAELLRQDANAIIGQWSNCNLTFCSDKIGKKDLSGQVIVASIQSIYKRAFDIPVPSPELVIIDEAHLLSEKDTGMYRKFLADLAVVNPHIKCIGFTATPFRRGTGYLHKGKNAIFSGIAYEIGILDLIDQGYLVPVSTPTMHTRMDVSDVKIQGGDYVQSQLEKAVDIDPLTRACVDEIMQHGTDRKKWLVFTSGISHCEHVRDEIKSRGISCDMVTGDTPTGERNRIVNAHKFGDLRCLVNVSVLTTGYDCPAIDLIAFMRPTRSPVLYIQMMGRAMRTYPGKSDAIALDFGSIIDTLGPIDRVRIPLKRGKGEAPHKTCPQCEEMNHASTRICPYCGFEFPAPEINIEKTISNAAVLSTQLKTEAYTVTKMSYFRHQKEGKPDSLRVEYLCGLTKSFTEWICLEHQGRTREMACYWWRSRSGQKPPNTVAEALTRTSELKIPSRVNVKKPGKYYEVVGVEFDDLK